MQQGKRKQQPPAAVKKDPPRTLNILQWNAEGVMKKTLNLAESLHKENIVIACLQETHLNVNHNFLVRGYETFRFDCMDRHKVGVLILVCNIIAVQELMVNTNQQEEINGIDMRLHDCTTWIYNAYCPPDRDLALTLMNPTDSNCVVLGDFKSHSERWGYNETERGEEVEHCEIDFNHYLLNSEEDEPTGLLFKTLEDNVNTRLSLCYK
jgi:exonuclease III